MYQTLSDEFVNQLFEGAVFGSLIDGSVAEKRKQIAKTLRDQIAGYWSGSTAYRIVVNGGFLFDAKTQEPKKLTALGTAFLETVNEY